METKLTDGLLAMQPRFQINIPLTDQIRFKSIYPQVAQAHYESREQRYPT